MSEPVDAGSSVVTPSCQDYPGLLKEMSGHPPRLFHQGLPLSRMSGHCVAVVGSRQASRYGLSWARSLGAALAREGVSVCSGLASGIDAAAHEGALNSALSHPTAGVPVAVLGHGFEHHYPPQNSSLRREIRKYGILLSEYPPDHPPTRWTFPARNRIIAGLCQTTVVVEAGPRSGSLHTARFANEAGRDVWVVPNRPGSPNSAGVLSLLRDGAIPMFDIEEFVAQLIDELKVTHPSDAPRLELSPELSAALKALVLEQTGEPSSLCRSLECSAMEAACRLAELEVLGLVKRSCDGTWEPCRWDLFSEELEPLRSLSLPDAR